METPKNSLPENWGVEAVTIADIKFPRFKENVIGYLNRKCETNYAGTAGPPYVYGFWNGAVRADTKASLPASVMILTIDQFIELRDKAPVRSGDSPLTPGGYVMPDRSSVGQIVKLRRDATDAEWYGIGKVPLPGNIGDQFKISYTYERTCNLRHIDGRSLTQSYSYPYCMFELLPSAVEVGPIFATGEQIKYTRNPTVEDWAGMVPASRLLQYEDTFTLLSGSSPHSNHKNKHFVYINGYYYPSACFEKYNVGTTAPVQAAAVVPPPTPVLTEETTTVRYYDSLSIDMSIETDALNLWIQAGPNEFIMNKWKSAHEFYSKGESRKIQSFVKIGTDYGFKVNGYGTAVRADGFSNFLEKWRESNKPKLDVDLSYGSHMYGLQCGQEISGKVLNEWINKSPTREWDGWKWQNLSNKFTEESKYTISRFLAIDGNECCMFTQFGRITWEGIPTYAMKVSGFAEFLKGSAKDHISVLSHEEAIPLREPVKSRVSAL